MYARCVRQALPVEYLFTYPIQREAFPSIMAAKHDWGRKPATEDEEEDPVENMIKKTGCIQHHYAVMECMGDNGDWRKCQKEVQTFRQCMTDYHIKQAGGKKTSTQT